MDYFFQASFKSLTEVKLLDMWRALNQSNPLENSQLSHKAHLIYDENMQNHWNDCKSTV